jgi:hypothetical protein
MKDLDPRLLNLGLDAVPWTTTRLEDLFDSAADSPGQIPNGVGHGTVVFAPDRAFGKSVSDFFGQIWMGKVIDRANGTVVNRLVGRRLVHGTIYFGESWFDGLESIIVDYSKTSYVAANIHDEIRCVAPGVYLGRAYLILPFGLTLASGVGPDSNAFFASWFILQFADMLTPKSWAELQSKAGLRCTHPRSGNFKRI